MELRFAFDLSTRNTQDVIRASPNQLSDATWAFIYKCIQRNCYEKLGNLSQN